MATNTTKDAQAAAGVATEPKKLTLRQKLIEMRKACPEIVKKKHSDAVSYKYAKIYDVWEKITPIMNDLGVDFDIVGEDATKFDEAGNSIYWETMTTKTRSGDRLMFLYEADLIIRWTDVETTDSIQAKIHAIGWNDDPAKAKGAAHTYALKYYLFEKFCIDQGEDDPDNADNGAQGRSSGGQKPQKQNQGPARLSDAQMTRMYKKGEAAGYGKDKINARIAKKYGKQDPATMTRQEYEDVCASLDAAAAKAGANGNAQQGE